MPIQEVGQKYEVTCSGECVGVPVFVLAETMHLSCGLCGGENNHGLPVQLVMSSFTTIY